MNTRSIPSRVLRRLAAPVVRAGSVVFFDRELSTPVARAEAPEGFVVREGSSADLPLLISGLQRRSEEMLRERFDRGDLCMLALDPQGKLAHASWISLSSAWIPELAMTLTVYPGEAYGYDFYTRPDLRGTRVFAAVRTFLCDRLYANGFARFFTYVAGENRSGLAGAASWQNAQGRMSYVRLRGTRGLVWGKCPFTLSPGRQLDTKPRAQPASIPTTPKAPEAEARLGVEAPRGIEAPPSVQAPPGVEVPLEAPLRVEVIENASALLAFRSTWDELIDRAGIDHPFLTHAWICAWWEAFGSGRELRILTVYAGDKCIAIAPMMLERTHLYGIPVRSVELIGNEHTPRSGFIVAERFDEAHRVLLSALHHLRERWQMAVLPQLAEGTQTLQLVEELARKSGIHTGVWQASSSPRLELKGDWESYLKTLRPKQRTNLRNRLNRLKRIGEVEFEEVTGGEGLAAALDDGLRIEAAGWKGSEHTAMSSSADSNRFYRRFAESAAARGWLCLDFLKVGGKRIAFSYGVRFNHIHYLIKQGYDPDHSAASPSQVLCSFIIQDSFRRGDRAVDFLGADEPWKREWTAESRGHSWLYLFHPGLATWPIHFAKFRLFPALRARWSPAAP